MSAELQPELLDLFGPASLDYTLTTPCESLYPVPAGLHSQQQLHQWLAQCRAAQHALTDTRHVVLRTGLRWQTKHKIQMQQPHDDATPLESLIDDKLLSQLQQVESRLDALPPQEQCALHTAVDEYALLQGAAADSSSGTSQTTTFQHRSAYALLDVAQSYECIVTTDERRHKSTNHSLKPKQMFLTYADLSRDQKSSAYINETLLWLRRVNELRAKGFVAHSSEHWKHEVVTRFNKIAREQSKNLVHLGNATTSPTKACTEFAHQVQKQTAQTGVQLCISEIIQSHHWESNDSVNSSTIAQSFQDMIQALLVAVLLLPMQRGTLILHVQFCSWSTWCTSRFVRDYLQLLHSLFDHTVLHASDTVQSSTETQSPHSCRVWIIGKQFVQLSKEEQSTLTLQLSQLIDELSGREDDVSSMSLCDAVHNTQFTTQLQQFTASAAQQSLTRQLHALEPRLTCIEAVDKQRIAHQLKRRLHIP